MGPYVGAAEIAEILDVSRQRVQQLVSQPGFPEPVADLAMGKVWRRKDVDEWNRNRRHARGINRPPHHDARG